MKNLFTLSLIVLLSNFSLTAQNLIEGGISNENGKSLTATITLENEQKAQFSKMIQTDEDGYFMIDDLANGNYQLIVEHSAYKTITIDNFEFPRDSDQILGLTMENLENTEITIARNIPENNTSIAVHK